MSGSSALPVALVRTGSDSFFVREFTARHDDLPSLHVIHVHASHLVIISLLLYIFLPIVVAGAIE
jgi:hypothetical protein